MIDLHCHILPGLDDGPATMDESVAMCRVAAADGITTIVATPHYQPGKYVYTEEQFNGKLDALRRRLRSEELGVRVLPGAEVGISPELLQNLSKHRFLTVNANARYFMAEFLHDMVPPRWLEFLSPLNLSGKVPILAHPERSRWFASHGDDLARFVDYGGLVQITSGSLLGDAGSDVRDFTVTLLKRNLVHIIASDAHSADHRPPRLATAIRRASEIVGERRAMAMVTDGPAAILEGNRVSMPAPQHAAEKKGWFSRMLTT